MVTLNKIPGQVSFLLKCCLMGSQIPMRHHWSLLVNMSPRSVVNHASESVSTCMSWRSIWKLYLFIYSSMNVAELCISSTAADLSNDIAGGTSARCGTGPPTSAEQICLAKINIEIAINAKSKAEQTPERECVCLYVCEPEPLRQPECSDVCEKKCRGHAEQSKCQTAVHWDMEQHGDPARTHSALVLGGRRWWDRMENSKFPYLHWGTVSTVCSCRWLCGLHGSHVHVWNRYRHTAKSTFFLKTTLATKIASLFSKMSPSGRDDRLCTSPCYCGLKYSAY